jgi:hypothetical protein
VRSERKGKGRQSVERERERKEERQRRRKEERHLRHPKKEIEDIDMGRRLPRRTER